MEVKDKITNFFFHPEEGGKVVLTGTSCQSGRGVTTTTVTNFAIIDGKKLVRTRTGSVYEVVTAEVTTRWMALQAKRPDIYRKLEAAGFTY